MCDHVNVAVMWQSLKVSGGGGKDLQVCKADDSTALDAKTMHPRPCLAVFARLEALEGGGLSDFIGTCSKQESNPQQIREADGIVWRD